MKKISIGLNLALIAGCLILAVNFRGHLHDSIAYRLRTQRIFFFGESILERAPTRDWRFRTRNFAIGGSNLRVVAWQAMAAIKGERTKPDVICVMTGSNDGPERNAPPSFEGDEKGAAEFYRTFLRWLRDNTHARIVIVSAPPQDSD